MNAVSCESELSDSPLTQLYYVIDTSRHSTQEHQVSLDRITVSKLKN